MVSETPANNGALFAEVEDLLSYAVAKMSIFTASLYFYCDTDTDGSYLG